MERGGPRVNVGIKDVGLHKGRFPLHKMMALHKIERGGKRHTHHVHYQQQPSRKGCYVHH